jgi:hypothetical protein
MNEEIPSDLLLINAALYIAPVLLTLGAAALLYVGLRRPQRVVWWAAGSSLLVLAGFAVWVYALARERYPAMGWYYAPNLALLATATAISAALVLGLTLQGRRKLAALGIGLLFPLVLLGAYMAGSAPSQAEIAIAQQERSTVLLVEELARYYGQNGNYPQSLDALVPVYLPELPEAPASQEVGWLYQGGGDDFVLGYPDYLRGTAAEPLVCLYSPDTPQGVCALGNWGPFEPSEPPEA